MLQQLHQFMTGHFNRPLDSIRVSLEAVAVVGSDLGGVRQRHVKYCYYKIFDWGKLNALYYAHTFNSLPLVNYIIIWTTRHMGSR